MVKFNEDIQTKTIDDDESMEEEEDFDIDDEENLDIDDDEEDDIEKTPIIKEDIYGRVIDAKGNVVKNNSSKTP